MLIHNLIAMLLPIAAASGWLAARKHYTRKYLTDFAHPLTKAYRRGLNYLLDEKTDKAIAAVASIIEQESEPLETHIALGNLFRRQGEVDKAIEIHKRLTQEPGLAGPQKLKASYELGVDYTRAGLLDRAEGIFLGLSETKTHNRAALQQLLMIYQQQKDWHKAIDCIVRLRPAVKPQNGETVAHFLCELAEEARTLHRLKDARDYLTQALQDDPASVRASISKGRLELGNGEFRQALATFKSIERQNPVYLSVVLPLIRLCWDRQGYESELLEYLDHLYNDFGIVSAAVERAERLQLTQGLAEAVEYLLPILEKTPDVLAITRALALISSDDRLHNDNLRRLSDLLCNVMNTNEQFLCEKCGFSTSELYWRCPSCQYWGAITPTGTFSSLPVPDQDTPLESAM